MFYSTRAPVFSGALSYVFIIFQAFLCIFQALPFLLRQADALGASWQLRRDTLRSADGLDVYWRREHGGRNALQRDPYRPVCSFSRGASGRNSDEARH